MSKAADYIFIVQQPGRRPLARIVSIESGNEREEVREVVKKLKNGNGAAEIHYARHPADDTIVIMEQLDDEPLS